MMQPVDEEERRAKEWMRAVTRRAARVFFIFFLLIALLLGTLQAVLVYGPRPLLFWGPLAAYAAWATLFAARRRWGLALACLLAAAAHMRVYRQASAIIAARSTL